MQVSKGTLIKTVVLAGLVALLYFPVVSGMVKDWWIDPNYSHGFLIPFISGYVLWQRKEILASLSMRPTSVGLVMVVTALLILFAGDLGAEVFLQRVSLLILICGMILYLVGKDHLKRLSFPMGLLLLMIPLPAIIFYQITFPLQLLASTLAAHLIQLTSIPVFQEGNILHMANTSIEIVEACSGIRSLFSLITLGLIVAYFTQSHFAIRALLVASTIPIAIVANALRLMGTAVLAHRFGARFAQGFFHLFSGWLILISALLLLLLEVKAISWVAKRRT
jgi:exosortase